MNVIISFWLYTFFQLWIVISLVLFLKPYIKKVIKDIRRQRFINNIKKRKFVNMRSV